MAEKTHTIQEELSAPVEEAYRVLRSNIQFCSFDKKIKSLVVTSCQPGEGKSTTSHNLAISMAKTGMNVLLVDADLRKPSVEKLVGQNHTQGLSTLIAGHAMLEEVIHRTSIKGFSYIACGPKPPNPAELMGSEAFHVFLKAATEMFDLVIIDTPPLGSVIDCAIISARVKVQLEKANARILGVVLNKMKKSDYKGYYNYYKYYGAEDREKGFFNRFKPFKKSEKVFT
jgi:protein-tyrosine kinase